MRLIYEELTRLPSKTVARVVSAWNLKSLGVGLNPVIGRLLFSFLSTSCFKGTTREGDPIHYDQTKNTL